MHPVFHRYPIGISCVSISPVSPRYLMYCHRSYFIGISSVYMCISAVSHAYLDGISSVSPRYLMYCHRSYFIGISSVYYLCQSEYARHLGFLTVDVEDRVASHMVTERREFGIVIFRLNKRFAESDARINIFI